MATRKKTEKTEKAEYLNVLEKTRQDMYQWMGELIRTKNMSLYTINWWDMNDFFSIKFNLDSYSDYKISDVREIVEDIIAKFKEKGAEIVNDFDTTNFSTEISYDSHEAFVEFFFNFKKWSVLDNLGKLRVEFEAEELRKSQEAKKQARIKAAEKKANDAIARRELYEKLRQEFEGK